MPPTRLQIAQQRVLKHFPRFSPLFLRTEIHLIPGVKAAFITSDLRIGLGELFLDDMAEASGVLMHELFHALLAHFARRGDRDPTKWNVACDIAINETLVKLFQGTGGQFKVGPDWLRASTFGLTLGAQIPRAEDLYNLLPDMPATMWVCGSGAGNDNPLEENLPGRVDPKTWEEVQIAIDQTQAELTQGPSAGWSPGGSAEFDMWKGVKPKPARVNWGQELAQAVGLERASYLGRNRVPDWRRMNRRGSGVLPGSSTTAPQVAVVVDTSGSMASDGDVVLGQIGGILTSLGPVRVLTVDTRVTSDAVVRSVDEFLTNARGGGGTDMTPGLAQVTDGITLCITDGDLGDPGPKYQDVVWVITRKGGRRAWMKKVVHAYGS